MTRDEIVRRGESASHLLNNPTALAALDEFEKECAAAWVASNPQDVALRDDAYQMVRCIKLLRLKLQVWRDDATAEIIISEQRQRDAAILN